MKNLKNLNQYNAFNEEQQKEITGGFIVSGLLLIGGVWKKKKIATTASGILAGPETKFWLNRWFD